MNSKEQGTKIKLKEGDRVIEETTKKLRKQRKEVTLLLVCLVEENYGSVSNSDTAIFGLAYC
jgi:phosphotransferase system IIA component